MNDEVYLGDSVYAQFDGYGIELTTHNGYDDDPRNRIYLDPEVLAKFLSYVADLRKRAEAEK